MLAALYGLRVVASWDHRHEWPDHRGPWVPRKQSGFILVPGALQGMEPRYPPNAGNSLYMGRVAPRGGGQGAAKGSLGVHHSSPALSLG